VGVSLFFFKKKGNLIRIKKRKEKKRTRKNKKEKEKIPEKQSILEAIVHLLAR